MENEKQDKELEELSEQEIEIKKIEKALHVAREMKVIYEELLEGYEKRIKILEDELFNKTKEFG